MTRESMMGLVREGKRKVRGPGYIVTWDVDGQDSVMTNRVRYFVFGNGARSPDDGLPRRGFVWKEGVRYVAQSTLFVKPHRLAEIRRFLTENGIDHDVDPVVFT